MAIIIFLLGLIVGSFLNCVIYRLENSQNFFWGHSFCPKCKHVLAWYDLVPVLSFLWLGGKCHYCKKRISIQYPLVELATGILFLLFFEVRPPSIDIWEVGLLFIVPFLVIIFVYDLKHYLIPDKIIYPAIGVAFIYNLWKLDLSVFGAAFGAAAFFFFIVLISRGKWMGLGDIKLALLMGLVLGWPNILVALFFAFLSGAIIGLGLVSIGKKSLKSEVPFGPFLVIGTLVAMFYGQNLINWYLSFYVQGLYLN